MKKVNFLTVYPGPMNTDFDKDALVENNTTFRKAKKKKISPNLIATKIYKYYKKRKRNFEINSIFINLIYIFKILFSNLFNRFLRFFLSKNSLKFKPKKIHKILPYHVLKKFPLDKGKKIIIGS